MEPPLISVNNDVCNMKMHGVVTVGTKGQIVIPSDVRKMLDIESGDTMFVITKHGKAIGLVKTQDLESFMEYMNQEMDLLKKMP